jgi:hypothetical protein
MSRSPSGKHTFEKSVAKPHNNTFEKSVAKPHNNTFLKSVAKPHNNTFEKSVAKQHNTFRKKILVFAVLFLKSTFLLYFFYTFGHLKRRLI